jgi:acetyl/propionyl-CoA carboxylase alpha subunit
MLAKLIAHGETREAAIRKLSYALRQSFIQGVQTNREFLIRLLDHREFRAGEAHTSFIAERLDELLTNDSPQLEAFSLAAAALFLQRQWQSSDPLLAELPPAYRNNPYRDPSIKFQIDGTEREVSWRSVGNNRFEVKAADFPIRARMLSCEREVIRLSMDGIQRSFNITQVDDWLYVQSPLGSCVVRRAPRHPIHQTAAEQGSANSPMPGSVLKLLIEVGQHVAAGDPLLVLEAMKMEHTMRAAMEGRVEAVLVKQGEVVAPGQLLVKITALP